MSRIVIPSGPSGGLQPDLSAFREAMGKLRQFFGQDVTFHVPNLKTWPDGTQLDPETGEPYDPAIEPLTGGWTDVVKHVGVITKPIQPSRGGADTRFEAGGEFSGQDAVLDMAAGDYPDVGGATEATVYGQRYKIVEMKPSGLGGVAFTDRYIVYLEAK